MHAHVHAGNSSRVLRFALLLTAGYIALLVVTGLRAHSLALLSEAGHNVSDFLALLLSWGAAYLQERPPSSTKTYGYHRAGVLAAFVNAGTLVLIALFIFYEAVQRLYNPVSVNSGTMMIVAGIGVVVNGVIAWMLMRTHSDLNIRSALVHMVGDTLATLAVVLGGLAIALTGHNYIDPVLSILIGVMIVWSSFGIIRESLNILLEGTPLGMELEQVELALRDIGGVNNVHDLHIWSIGSESHALSCHIAIADIPPSESESIMREVQRMLAERFRILHTTIQFEHVVCDIAHGCIIVPEGDQHRHTH
ncbi:MAG: cation diffusion facilitator family transporter [Terriglobia bacterium]|jgi:cobalt-zinc-cadmium efflux system protein|nr:cation diffusion facilitator family transporter [Terriglobia bacterium]